MHRLPYMLQESVQHALRESASSKENRSRRSSPKAILLTLNQYPDNVECTPDENVHHENLRTIFSHFWHIGIRPICMQRIYNRLSGASRPIIKLPSLDSPPAFSRAHVLGQSTLCIAAHQPSACLYARARIPHLSP